MQPLTGPYVYGVNRRSENFLLLSDLLFARGRCTRSRYKRVEICCFGLCIQFNDVLEGDIYRHDQGLRSATGLQRVIFIELVQYAKNIGGKFLKIWLSIR